MIGALLGYLVVHPQAKDSIDGVHGWWLSDGRDWPRRQVEKALGYLIKENILEALEYGGREIYHLRPERRDDLPGMLEVLADAVDAGSEDADG